MICFPSCRNATIWASLAIVGLALTPHCELALAADAANAAVSSPAGKWKTFDDATGKLKSIVDIREQNGELDGTIETLFDPAVPHPTCFLCSGENKDVPLFL